MIQRTEYTPWDRDNSPHGAPRPPDPAYFEQGDDGEYYGYRERTETGPRSWRLGPWLQIDHVKKMQKNEHDEKPLDEIRQRMWI